MGRRTQSGPGHVKQAGSHGAAVAGHLSGLVRKKTLAQYDPKPVRPTEAEGLVTAARRAVNAARKAFPADDDHARAQG